MPDARAGYGRFADLASPILSDPQRRARVDAIKEEVMAIDAAYKQKAAVAADALRAALIAVEECGADIELTAIVMHLGDDRTKLCRLFGLPPEQAFQEARLASE